MEKNDAIRALFRLANRLEINASHIRNANLPHHLITPRRRMLRHLKELNQIRDRWSDAHKPARRRRKDTRPMITAYDHLSHWDNPWRKKPE